MTSFELHSNFSRKVFVADLPLCRILLEDNRHYPWVFLVPRRPSLQKIMDLTREDQLQLLTELDLVQRILWKEFQPSQLNVAAIGNKTPQLHLHVIARFQTDPAWPGTVWDHSAKEPYTSKERILILEKLTKAIEDLHSICS